VHIENNDCDKPNYDFTIQAEATCKVEVIPNPNKENFIVTAISTCIQSSHVVVESLLGVRVAENSVFDGEAFQMNLEHLANGIYLLRIESDSKLEVHRVVIGK
jgi:hypothetical protein